MSNFQTIHLKEGTLLHCHLDGDLRMTPRGVLTDENGNVIVQFMVERNQGTSIESTTPSSAIMAPANQLEAEYQICRKFFDSRRKRAPAPINIPQGAKLKQVMDPYRDELILTLDNNAYNSRSSSINRQEHYEESITSQQQEHHVLATSTSSSHHPSATYSIYDTVTGQYVEMPYGPNGETYNFARGSSRAVARPRRSRGGFINNNNNTYSNRSSTYYNHSSTSHQHPTTYKRSSSSNNRKFTHNSKYNLDSLNVRFDRSRSGERQVTPRESK